MKNASMSRNLTFALSLVAFALLAAVPKSGYGDPYGDGFRAGYAQGTQTVQNSAQQQVSSTAATTGPESSDNSKSGCS